MFGTNSIKNALIFISLSGVMCLLSSLSFAETSPKFPHLHLVSFVDPPYVFDEESNQAGLVERLVHKLFQHAEISYDLTLLPKKRAILSAEKTPNTCVVPIERNQEREAKFMWISPILFTSTGLFQLIERPISTRFVTLTDSKNFRIGSHLGSATGEYLASMGFNIDVAAKNSANIYKMKAGRIDLWESDSITAEYVSQKTGIKISSSELDFFTHLKAIGCHIDTSQALSIKMRQSLKKMYSSGFIDKVMSDFERR